MVERFKGPTPDGQEIATWYRLSKAEALKLVQDEVVRLEPEKTPDDLVDAEIVAYPGKEQAIEDRIKSWGLSIQSIGRG